MLTETHIAELISATRESMSFFIPEGVLAIGLILLIVLDFVLKPISRRRILPRFSAGLTLIVTGLAWGMIHVSPTVIFSGLIVVDPFASYLKVFIGLATFVTILVSIRNRELEPYAVGEYYVLLLALFLSGMLLVGSVNLLMLMLSLEMVSVSSYLLVGYRRERRASMEAALKYIVFGAAASGTMLFAISWIYGLTGSLYLGEISSILSDQVPSSPGWIVIMMLLLAGVAFKIAAVPFHFWAPDAYQAAATPVTAHLTVAPKAAGFAMLIRLFYHGFSVYHPQGPTGFATWEPIPGLGWPALIAMIAVATMTWGNTVAIWQKNIKRMLAYSSIGHAGYMLMGALVMTQEGIQALLFYFLAYLIMNMGAFIVVMALSDVLTDYENIDAYKGLWRQHPWLTLFMALFLLSLAGIPPLIGFWGKFFLFSAAIHAGWTWLAVIAVINSAISLFYYVYVIKNMVMDPSEHEISGVFAPLTYRIAVLFGIGVLLFGILVTPFNRLAGRSSEIAGEFVHTDIRNRLVSELPARIHEPVQPIIVKKNSP